MKDNTWQRRTDRQYGGGSSAATALLIGLAALASGCLTPYPAEPDPEQVRIRTEIANLGQNVDRLQHRLEVVQEEQERLQQELDELRRAGRQQNETLSQVRAETDERFREYEKARTADRQFMVDEVSRRLAEHLNRVSAPPTPTTSATGPQRGRYHEVQPGETLSEIAHAYNVRVPAIVRANELDNPDRLRVGQRLFIPD